MFNTITGGSGADTITGGTGADTITGGAGADTINGGDNSDIYIFNAGDVAAGEVTNDTGASGTDTIRLGTGNVDFTAATTISGIEALTFTAAQTATFNASQLPTSLAVTGTTGVQAIVINNASSFNASAWTFPTWTNGTDTITINGTAGDDTITGSNMNDTITGGAGGHDQWQ